MAIVEKTNPKGIDVVVSKLQKAINSKLPWGNKLIIFPRCYPYIKDNRKIIENIEGNPANEYTNLCYAEVNKCFFVQSADIEKVDLKNYSTSLDLYFTLDLSEIFPNEEGRRDAEAHSDVLKVLNAIPNIEVSRLITRIDRVFAGYDHRQEDDMQPYHCFKVVIDVLRFDPKQIC